jgi:hypothetical protein
MAAFVDAAAPSASFGDGGTDEPGGERRFAPGACVRVADRVWAEGGAGVVTMAHPDGTYDVNVTAVRSAVESPQTMSWFYLQPCEGVGLQSKVATPPALPVWPCVNSTAADNGKGTAGKLYVDMAAESCGIMQNGTHSGWACGYLTPPAVMRGLRAMVAAAAAPGLTPAQVARVARSSLPARYVSLMKWEELLAHVGLHPEQGSWPLASTKEEEFATFTASLKSIGITNLGGPTSVTGLHGRIFGKAKG